MEMLAPSAPRATVPADDRRSANNYGRADTRQSYTALL
jgi:hypothetical protein